MNRICLPLLFALVSTSLACGSSEDEVGTDRGQLSESCGMAEGSRKKVATKKELLEALGGRWISCQTSLVRGVRGAHEDGVGFELRPDGRFTVLVPGTSRENAVFGVGPDYEGRWTFVDYGSPPPPDEATMVEQQQYQIDFRLDGGTGIQMLRFVVTGTGESMRAVDASGPHDARYGRLGSLRASAD